MHSSTIDGGLKYNHGDRSCTSQEKTRHTQWLYVESTPKCCQLLKLVDTIMADFKAHLANS